MKPVDLTKITAAREQGSLLHVRLYCENVDCPAREIDVRLKDYDARFETFVGAGVVCPICGSANLSMHHILTDGQQAAEDEAEARRSVIVQMYVRDEKARHGSDAIVLMSASVLGAEGKENWLPPTPDGFWERPRG